MSSGLRTRTRPDRTGGRGGPRRRQGALAARVATGVAIAGVVAAALVVALWEGEPDDPVARAEAQVAELYEAATLSEARELLVAGSVDDDPQAAGDVDEAIMAALRQPFTVDASQVLSVGDAEVVQVMVNDVPWCVRADDAILLGCRVANVEVDAAVDADDLTVIFADVDVLAHRVDLVTVVASETADPIAIEEAPTLTPPDAVAGRWELAETSLVGGGQRVELPIDMLQIYPDAGALFLFEGRDIAELPAIDGETFTVTWEGVTVTATITSVEWLVE